MGLTFVGEAVQRLLPLPIPGSVYSPVLLFVALCTGIVKLEQVKEVGNFLTSILPIILLLLGTTVFTFGISGSVVQYLTKKGEKEHA